MVCVTGGKLTTYRRMSEDTVDEVVRFLGGAAGPVARRCITARMAIKGAEGFSALAASNAAAEHGLDDEIFAALLRRHGGETPELLDMASGRRDMLEPLVEGLPQLKVEALWAVRREMALTLEDVLSRRTRATLRRALAAAEAASSVGALLAGEWDRSAQSLSQEANAFALEVRGDLARAGVKVDTARTGARGQQER